nr:hypothetical protein [Tanacetum cinerariifolium]
MIIHAKVSCNNFNSSKGKWRERFMNYPEEQTDGEAMINSIENDDHPLHTAEEKKTRNIDRLARSLLIQGLPNDIYSLIDSNETAKDLWDALKRQMRGSEYGEQDRNLLFLINDLKKCGYKKDNCELNCKFLNNLQPEWKQYGDVNDALRYKKKVVVVTSNSLVVVAEKTKLSKAFNRKKYYAKKINNNLRTSSASSSANKKPEYVKSVEKKEDKKADEKKKDMSKVKCYNCKKEGHFAKDCKKAKDQAWMESSSDNDQEINANMVFMAKMEKVLSDSNESSSSAKETIAEKCIEKANQQTKDLEIQNKDLQDKYDVLINEVNTFEEQNNKFNEQMKVLNEKNADLLTQTEVLQDQLKALCDNDKQHRKKIDEQEILFDK